MRRDQCAIVRTSNLRTNLVDDRHQSLAVCFSLPNLIFDPLAPRSFRIPRVEHLNDDIAPVDDLLQLSSECTDRRISDSKGGIQWVGGDEAIYSLGIVIVLRRNRGGESRDGGGWSRWSCLGVLYPRA